MIGAAVYRLRAEQSAFLPFYHGGLLHGAFFSLMQQFSPELSQAVHDASALKPFALSQLVFRGGQPQRTENGYNIKKGQEAQWRVTAWNPYVMGFLRFLCGGIVATGARLSWRVEDMYMSPDEHAESGVLDEAEFYRQGRSVKRVKKISMDFLSPVSSRRGDRDYPVPIPEILFPSLADKWNTCAMPVQFDKAAIRERAAEVLPCALEGKTVQIYYDKHRGATGFRGRMVYDVSALPREGQQDFLLLAQLAVFTGSGRLTAQGLGQTRVSYV